MLLLRISPRGGGGGGATCRGTAPGEKPECKLGPLASQNHIPSLDSPARAAPHTILSSPRAGAWLPVSHQPWEAKC